MSDLETTSDTNDEDEGLLDTPGGRKRVNDHSAQRESYNSTVALLPP